MEELWALIEDFPKYAVSNHGRIRNTDTGHVLKGRSNGQGYLKVTLTHDGVHKQAYIHQLVFIAFFPDHRDGLRVTHFDENKSNNKVDNLKIQWRPEKYIHPRSTAWGRRVMIVETGEVFRTVYDCARYIVGDYSSIYACLRGQRRTHLGYTFEYLEDTDG